jgi:hypothetical protein
MISSSFLHAIHIVLPDHIAVAKAHEAFNADGFLKDSRQQSGIEGLGHTLASFLIKLKGQVLLQEFVP